MSKLKTLSVTLELTVQPRQFHSMKLGLSAQRVFDEEEVGDIHGINSLREDLSLLLREGLYREIEKVYGSETAAAVLSSVEVK